MNILEEFKTNRDYFSNNGLAPILLKGAVTGILEKACGGPANRYLVLKVLTGKTSSKLLDESEWYALMCIVQPEKPVGGKWQSTRGDAELYRICQELLRIAVDQPGQGTLPF